MCNSAEVNLGFCVQHAPVFAVIKMLLEDVGRAWSRLWGEAEIIRC